MAVHSDQDAPLVDLHDIEKLPLFLFLGAASWVLPAGAWPVIAGGLARASGRLFASRRTAYARFVPESLAASLLVSKEAALDKYVAGYYEEYMQVLRSYRPGGWRPDVRLTGSEHIDDALAAGHGAILWITDAAFSPLLVKAGLARAGYHEAGLSRPQHGFSRTRLGMRFLNPIQANAENRYLARRIVIRNDRADIAFRALMDCLNGNELVGITVGDQAQRVEEVPLFEGVLRVATGPVNLSERTGAPLLPVFLVPLGIERFEVRIEPPLPVPAGVSYRAVIEDYVRLVEEYVQRYPLMWRGWVEHGNWKRAADGEN